MGGRVRAPLSHFGPRHEARVTASLHFLRMQSAVSKTDHRMAGLDEVPRSARRNQLTDEVDLIVRLKDR
jgi:hypothetical protein